MTFVASTALAPKRFLASSAGARSAARATWAFISRTPRSACSNALTSHALLSGVFVMTSRVLAAVAALLVASYPCKMQGRR